MRRKLVHAESAREKAPLIARRLHLDDPGILERRTAEMHVSGPTSPYRMKERSESGCASDQKAIRHGSTTRARRPRAKRPPDLPRKRPAEFLHGSAVRRCTTASSEKGLTNVSLAPPETMPPDAVAPVDGSNHST